MHTSAKASLMRRINRAAVLNLIRRSDGITRPGIARKLNMSLPTVMRIVDALMTEDLVQSKGTDEATRGRPADILEFTGGKYAILGIDLGGTKIYGTVANLLGDIQHEVYVEHGKDGSSGHLDSLSLLIDELLRAPRPSDQRIWGIGVGVPGITLRPDGIVVAAPSLEWRAYPLQEILAQRFGMRVLVENDVNLAALGEWEFGAGRGSESMVYITIGTGIGAGIILGGEIFRGFNQAAGEIGHFVPAPQYLGRRYDQFGALEHVASGTGIRDRARDSLRQMGAHESADDISAEGVFTAAEHGEAWATRIVSDAVASLAVAVAGIAVTFNPEMIVFSGGVMKSGHTMVSRIRSLLDGAIPYVPKLVLSQIGYRAAALGAISLLSDMTTDQVKVKHIS